MRVVGKGPELRKPARRLSLDLWHTLAGAVTRQHTVLAETDPASPRIRPTLPQVSALYSESPQPRPPVFARSDWPFSDLQPHAYRVILIDPPCAHASGPNRNPQKHYQTMKLPEIAALPVGGLAHSDGARLLLWLPTNRMLWAHSLLAAWGFEFCTVRPWLKLWPKKKIETAISEVMNAATSKDAAIDIIAAMISKAHGYESRNSSELLITAKRGRPQRLGNEKFEGAIIARRRQHSRKPECVRDEIIKLLDGPRCELFARSRHPGFDCWGDEVDLFDGGAT